MNRDNREITRHNHALGDVLRDAIDDVVAAAVPLSPDDVVNVLRGRLEAKHRELVKPKEEL